VSAGKWIAAGGGVLTIAVATVAVLGLGGQDQGTPALANHPAKTTKITKGTLQDQKTVSGELDYGDPIPLNSQAQGTVTWLPATGSTIKRGGTLFKVDNEPVTLLYGAMPAYRPLAPGTEGADVKQFEQNLKALGYTGFTVDTKYNASTASAVKKWQKALHKPETGVVTPADIVYTDSQVRIQADSVRLGAPGGGQILTYTGTRKVVSVDVNAGDHAWAAVGTAVTVKLPGGTEVAGKIDKVADEATAASNGGDQPPGADNATISVTITIADQAKLGSLAKTPVDVHYIAEERKDVLTVPVSALLALAEGGYGIEVLDSTGTHTVAVQVGLFADGRVEVSGPAVSEGLDVGMPS
jgi:peptidoglycan hydrolase-like protein with peptidoglycan-binding domain